MDDDDDVGADDVRAHKRLLENVRKLATGDSATNKKRRDKHDGAGAKSVRPALVDTATSDLAVESLLSSVNTARGALGKLMKTVKSTSKRHKVLQTPLHYREQEKIARSVAYAASRRDLNRWQDLVVNNRLAEQVTFPLEGDKFRDLPTLVDRARAHTLPAMSTLEQRTRDVLMKSENNMSTTAVLTDAEKKLVQAMSAQEARSKMAELRRVRIVLDSKEAKYRHWKKIKAKGFHRRLNRMMRNRLVKEYEQLKDRDPAAADEKLQELETARVMERATLRHGAATGKWAKVMVKAAQHNPQLREQLQARVRDAQSRKEKIVGDKQDSSDESENDNNEENSAAAVAALNDQLNKEAEAEAERMMQSAFVAVVDAGDTAATVQSDWLRDNVRRLRSGRGVQTAPPLSALTMEKKGAVTKQQTEDTRDDDASDSSVKQHTSTDVDGKSVDELFDRIQTRLIPNADVSKPHRQNVEQKSKRKRRKKLKKNTTNDNDDETCMPLIDESTTNRRTLKEMDDLVMTAGPSNASVIESHVTSGTSGRKLAGKNATAIPTMIDVHHMLHSVTHTVVDARAHDAQSSNMDDADEYVRPTYTQRRSDQDVLIADAFADDDLIGAFEQEKSAKTAADTPNEIELALPGWGHWAGPNNMQAPKHKRQRFNIKAPTVERKDRFLPGVIISERKDDAVKKHQVQVSSALPFPYTSVADFEAVLSQPLGPEWLPAQAHAAVTRAPVRTTAGRIIRPMHKATALAAAKKNKPLVKFS